MERLSFSFSRAVGVHYMKIAWMSAAILFFVSMAVPTYNAALTQLGILSGRVGVVVGMVVFFGMRFLQKHGSDCRWQQLVESAAKWEEMGPARRAGWTIFFIGLALMCLCFGVAVGALFTLIF